VNQGFYRFLVFSCVAILALSLTIVGGTSAQVISADLVGTVLDKTAAAVPGAAVEAVNSETGVKYDTQANANGEYRFNNLPVGTYSVSGSSSNFATTTINNFQLELNKTSTLQITLEIKGAATSIEVSGAAPALDTTTSQITTTFDAKMTADLPVSSVTGGVLNLSLLGAGVATGGGIGAGTGPSIGGQRPRNNNFAIEGVDNNNKSVTGPLVSIPNDAVAEFSVLQNQFTPDFGHSSGGQFNTIIKSGTNSFHGDVYIYSENRNFNAIDQSVINNALTSNPRYDNNRIGGTFGGPIVKNKLFFFGALEYNPVGAAAVLGAPVCAPTADGYSALAALPGISATNLAILQKYVAPAGSVDTTGTCGPSKASAGVETVTSNTGATASVPEGILSFSGPNFTNNWAALGSIDYDISQKDQLRGRYVYNRTVGIDTAANLPAFYINTPTKFHLLTLNEYHTFNPNTQNEFRLGYNRYANNTPAGNFSFPGLDSFPNIVLNTLNGLNIGPDGNAPQFTIINTYQLSDNISWTHSKHTVKLGIEGRKYISPQSFTQRARGDYEYNSLQQYLNDMSPDALAQRSVGQSTYYGDQSALYWFVNDNWRIRQNLTLNFGVRWEYTTTPFGIRSQSLNSIASVPGVAVFDEPRAPKNDWGPRIGFAYSPGTSGRTSIRGGFGIAYDVHYDNIGILSLPPELSVTENTPSLTKTTPNFLASGGLPPGTGGINTFATPADARAATSTYYPPDVKDPKSMDWTLGVQHSFWNDYTVEVRYIGTRGVHLNVQSIVNLAAQTTPALHLPTYIGNVPDQAALDASTVSLGTILNSSDGVVPIYDAAGFNGNALTAFIPAGSSTYHGLALQVTRRMSHGLQFVGAYTYSHLIDNSTADFHSTDLTPRRQQDFTNLAADRSNSALDHRHRFTMAVVYDVPFFKNGNFLTRNVLGNWEIAPIYTYQTGEWATAQSGVDANLNGDQAGDRTITNPAGVGVTGSGVSPLCRSNIPTADCTLANANNFAAIDPNSGVTYDVADNLVGYSALNPSAKYVQAYLGALANTGRNTILTPPTNNFDATAIKRFAITERYKVEFAVQAFNLLNHPQFIPCCAPGAGPGALGGATNAVTSQGVLGSPRFALEPQRGIFNNFSAVFPSEARALQLSLKIFF
jgi:Carboxypeptidase regulatory-like domain